MDINPAALNPTSRPSFLMHSTRPVPAHQVTCLIHFAMRCSARPKTGSRKYDRILLCQSGRGMKMPLRLIIVFLSKNIRGVEFHFRSLTASIQYVDLLC